MKRRMDSLQNDQCERVGVEKGNRRKDSQHIDAEWLARLFRGGDVSAVVREAKRIQAQFSGKVSPKALLAHIRCDVEEEREARLGSLAAVAQVLCPGFPLG